MYPPPRAVSAVTRRHGEFSGFFWLIGTAFALRNFVTLTTVGGFSQFYPQFAM